MSTFSLLWERCKHTWPNSDCEGAFGNGDASKRDGNGVRASLDWAVGAAEHAVSLVLQDGLHCVLVALRVFDHSADFTYASPCGQDTGITFQTWMGILVTALSLL